MKSKIMAVDNSGRFLIPKKIREKYNITDKVSVSELNGSIFLSNPNRRDTNSTPYILNEIDELRKNNVALIKRFLEFEKVIVSLQTNDRQKDKDTIAEFIGER